MNARQLIKLGIPQDCVPAAIGAIQSYVKSGAKGKKARPIIKEVVENPSAYVEDDHFGTLAKTIVEYHSYVPSPPAEYKTWGSEIDDATREQMNVACKIPSATAGALLPDAHLGYGLPIGGVLATKDEVIPYAVGVDPACRMKLSLLDMPPNSYYDRFNLFKEALEQGTKFGLACAWDVPKEHEVMDEDWTVTKVTRERKDTAHKQLGTSGGGNHFVDIGLVVLNSANPYAIDFCKQQGIEPGSYIAIMSHSGSRGAGHALCQYYSTIASQTIPHRHKDMSRLGWLSMESEAGQEYWQGLQLMGKYAAGCHAVIHRTLSKLLGAQIVGGIENHHNFAWKEMHGGEEVVVHRKGATPAAEGELGVIPGSMDDIAYIVRGKGNPDSLNSASHGAGRCLSRTKAKERFSWNSVQKNLEHKFKTTKGKEGVIVLAAGADEAPGAYKKIEQVIAEQSDLIDIVGTFVPKIVMMSPDRSKAED